MLISDWSSYVCSSDLKCLVELSGRTVLHWQLAHLAGVGVREAVVVTGFGSDKVDAEVAGLDLPGMAVRNLFNPFYALSDHLATCWMARGELAGGALLLNGASLFEPAIADRMSAATPCNGRASWRERG